MSERGPANTAATVPHTRNPLPALAVAALATAFLITLLLVESQVGIAALIAGAAIATIAAARQGLLTRITAGLATREDLLGALCVAGVLVVTVFFHEDHFVLLMVATLILFVVATLGLNIQFGYTGLINFAGSSFLGVGSYTAAVLTMHTALPHLLVLLMGGVMAAAIGSLLLLPVLRTRGHYSAVVTIAFALLFKTFLEVNDILGGPQGLAVAGMDLFGWSFNDNIVIGDDFELSFYANYVLLSLAILVVAFIFVRRLDRSWIGLNLDAVRLDETAAACFGLNILRWKITAFTLGNFLIGVAGALYGMMLGFIAPANFTFGDSLILVSIVLLGGLGNAWGLVVATAIVVIIPEKLQAIQEYRFLLYASMVILILLFRPQGLIPRPLRTYFPGFRTR
ncbi:MAG: branched-chain amino acid ABC transporter permease [Rhodospirillales bacterium]|nr:branched-chain amino acid ABC transporter permease [Rhodospirillales bacterium]